MNLTKEELEAVVRWIEDRADFLRAERIGIECDDFAHSNGHWPRVETLRGEETAMRIALDVAKEQLGENHNDANTSVI